MLHFYPVNKAHAEIEKRVDKPRYAHGPLKVLAVFSRAMAYLASIVIISQLFANNSL